MKEQQDALQRLFRAARRAPVPVGEMPFGFENRVLAAWREVRGEDQSLWMLVLFKRAFVAACVVALLSVALTYPGLQDAPGPSELTLADSLIKMSLFP